MTAVRTPLRNERSYFLLALFRFKSNNFDELIPSRRFGVNQTFELILCVKMQCWDTIISAKWIG